MTRWTSIHCSALPDLCRTRGFDDGRDTTIISGIGILHPTWVHIRMESFYRQTWNLCHLSFDGGDRVRNRAIGPRQTLGSCRIRPSVGDWSRSNARRIYRNRIRILLASQTHPCRRMRPSRHLFAGSRLVNSKGNRGPLRSRDFTSRQCKPRRTVNPLEHPDATESTSSIPAYISDFGMWQCDLARCSLPSTSNLGHGSPEPE